MADISAEEAMRRACDLILQGDIFSAMADLTAEAANAAMALGVDLSGVPLPDSYEIESHEESSGDHRFGVCFHTSLRDLRAWATWREIDGAWRIVAIGVTEQ